MIKLPTLKLVAMVNCLLLLLVAFVSYYTLNPPTLGTAPISTATTDSPAMAISATSATPSTNPDLANLPYVSADGLKQQAQAQAQAVMYSTVNQPRIQARSSR
ncbi:hypothetical protein [uncultured Moraxella sp.]|uniref:hypothetical protein n=1 Tax=uncultured Moraxella sp. TaxID=263769 RepID=UPI0025FF716F|nr:hypothetical protein [uncultured Moraxella sp.]